MKDFRTLLVWQKAHILTLAVYQATKSFPKEEIYGLTSQMRRSSSSVPTNIAEGCGRNSDGQLAYFLRIAMGSASELEYQLLLAHDLEYLPNEIYDQLNLSTVEIKNMLTAFILKMRK